MQDIMILLRQNFQRHGVQNNWQNEKVETHINEYLQKLSLIKSSPDHIQQLIFLLDICNNSHMFIQDCYDIDEQETFKTGSVKFSLYFVKLKHKIDMQKLMSFKNWDHLSSIWFYMCQWFGDVEWRILVDHADCFTQLKSINLQGNNIAEVTKQEIERFKSLQYIQLGLNQLNQETQRTLLQLRRINKKIRINFTYQNEEQWQKIQLAIYPHIQQCVDSMAPYIRIDYQEQQQKQLSKIKQQYTSGSWFLNWGSYNGWDLVLKCMQEAFTWGFNLKNNEFKDIPKQIVQVRWYNLEQINLSQNRISNIQSLCHISMLHMSQIDLSKNKISSFKTLSKSKWDSLMSLCIDGNPCQQIPQMHRTKASIRIKIFGLVKLRTPFSASQDLSIALKYQSRRKQPLQNRPANFIQQKKVNQVIKRKEYKISYLK